MSESPGGVSSTNESLTQGAQMRRRGRRTIGTGVAVTIAVVLLAAGLGGGYLLGSNYGSSSKAGAQSYTITETGSTLIFPYMNLLGPAYSGLYPNIQVSPQGTGSGTGISSAESNITDIGGTDAYLLPATAAKYSLINVPVAISAQLAVYNIPGITTHLNLNGTVLAMIYSEAITYWNDPLIQAAKSRRGATPPADSAHPPLGRQRGHVHVDLVHVHVLEGMGRRIRDDVLLEV